MQRSSPHSLYWWVFGALSLVASYSILSQKYLRMVDLPGHVAQLTMIQRALSGDPLPPGFEWNLATPYLLGYALALPLAFVVSAGWAVKFWLAAYAVLTPLSVRYLLGVLGCERWWSLPFFVFAFCHPYHHGFYSYLVATPLGILALAVTIRARDRKERSWALATTGIALLLLVSHVLVFLIAFGMSAAYLVGDSSRSRPPRELLWWLPALAGFALWWTRFSGPAGPSSHWKWDVGFHRLPQIGAGAIGDARDLTLGWVVLAVLFVLLAIAGPPFRIRRGALVMSLAIVGLALVCPVEVDGISHLGWRLSLWALVGVAALLGPLGTDRRSHVARGVTVVVLLIAIGWIGTGMRAFDREARSFDAVLADMADDKTLHPLFFDFRGETGPSRDQVFSYLHFGAWYYVEKGGLYAGMFRFAPRHLPIVRATPLAGSEWREDFTYWSESGFDLDLEGGYDYYLLRQRDPTLARGFLDRHDGLVEISNSGPWHLLERAPAVDR